MISLIIALLVCSASAHVRLDFPTPRSDATGLKQAPVGGVGAQGFHSVLVAGQNNIITWTETVFHPGYFQISFSTGGEQESSFTNITGQLFQHDTENSDPHYAYNTSIPNQVCDSNYCKLRLIQLMEPNTFYYTTADVLLTNQTTYDQLMATCPTSCVKPVFTNNNSTCLCDYWSNNYDNTGSITSRSTSNSSFSSAPSSALSLVSLLFAAVVAVAVSAVVIVF